MKPASVLIDMACYPEGPNRTSTLTAEEHSPELLPDGWLRFKVKGVSYLIPPWAIKRVTEPSAAIEALDRAAVATTAMIGADSSPGADLTQAAKKRGRPKSGA